MIGQQLKLIRKARKRTQTWVAREVGTTKSYICLIENDKRDPSLRVLKEICESLNAEIRIIPKL